MTHLETVWRQLLQRRLLPVAILMVAALAAIPFLLAKDPKPAPPAPVTDTDRATAAAALPEPIVETVDAAEPQRRRRVLGARKNPFQPAAAPKDEEIASEPTASTPVTGAPGSTGSAGATTTAPKSGATGGSTGGTTMPGMGDAPAAGGSEPPVADPPKAKKPEPKEHELYSITVRFGDSTAGGLKRMTVGRLRPLPNADAPVLVYLGVSEDEDTAVFMVDEGVEVAGDGVCRPSPSNCETLHMRKGDTEFFDVKGASDDTAAAGAQYQLDLLDIKRKTTKSARKAEAARARESKAGRRVLRARQAAAGPLRYRYDAKRGVVKKLDRAAYKAAVARVARAALASAGAFDITR
jgi:hypothetical protein